MDAHSVFSDSPPPSYHVHPPPNQGRSYARPQSHRSYAHPPPSYQSTIYTGPSFNDSDDSDDNESTVLLPQPTHANKRAERPSKLVVSFLPILVSAFLALFIAQNLCFLPILLDDIPATEKAALRKEWISERDAHNAFSRQWARDREQYNKEQQHWVQERAKWEQDRRDEERHRKEVERRRQGVYWTNPVGDGHCHGYGTRVYRAVLKDVPPDLNWLEVCVDMPVTIHGRVFDKPDCYRDNKGDIWGSWLVDFDEPSCVPYWGRISDEGCAPGQKRVARAEARLWGIPSGDDWEMMCATTPAAIHGHNFSHPTTCENRGAFLGVVGVWDYPAWWC